MEKREKYLPIGSVVLLSGETKKLMITGFCSSEEGEEKEYDYSGCLYPEGLVSSDEIYLFDHEQINEINFIGYENEEEKEFKKELIENIDSEDDNDTIQYDSLGQ